MNKLKDGDNTTYAAVDDALRTYPLQPAPKNLLPAVMVRIQTRRSTPEYLPTWMDFALSLFAAGMAAYAVWLWSIFQRPPNWTMRLQFQLLIWWQHIHLWFLLRPWPVLYILVLLMGIALSMMLLKAIWLAIPGMGTPLLGKLPFARDSSGTSD